MLERREKMLVNILIVMGIIIGGLIALDFLTCLAIIIAAKIKDIREDRRLTKRIRYPRRLMKKIRDRN